MLINAPVQAILPATMPGLKPESSCFATKFHMNRRGRAEVKGATNLAFRLAIVLHRTESAIIDALSGKAADDGKAA